jgi:hypothetical protein
VTAKLKSPPILPIICLRITGDSDGMHLLNNAMCDFLIIFYKRIEGEIEKAYLQYN